MYYAVNNVNGPISVRMDEVDLDAIEQHDREWIDDARTDAEDDLGIDGADMSRTEFEGAMLAAGAKLVKDSEYSDGWQIFEA